MTSLQGMRLDASLPKWIPTHGGPVLAHERSTADRPLLLRLNEAAQALGIGRSTVYELIQAGELPVIHIGRAVRIPSAALAAWVERKAVVAASNRGPDDETAPR